MSEPLSFKARVQEHLLSEPLARHVSENAFSRPARRRGPMQAVADARMQFLKSEQAPSKERAASTGPAQVQAILSAAKPKTSFALQLPTSPIPGQKAHVADPVLALELERRDFSNSSRHSFRHGNDWIHVARAPKDRAQLIMELIASGDYNAISDLFPEMMGMVSHLSPAARSAPELDHLMGPSSSGVEKFFLVTRYAHARPDD